MKNYSNKIALITGASSGIGREMSLQIAQRGARPILIARRKNELEQVAAEIKSRFNKEALFIPTDLTDQSSLNNMVKEVENSGLNVDILINNAGFGYKGAFNSADIESYRNMTTLNMTALTELTWHFSKGMLERGSGAILNVASMAGVGPIPKFAVYAATKAYVISFSEALWQEFKPFGVHVTALCPGPVETEFFDVAKMDPKKMSMRTIQKADEVAKIALDSLLQNERVVPTSVSLKIMRAASALTPNRLGLIAAEMMMGKEL